MYETRSSNVPLENLSEKKTSHCNAIQTFIYTFIYCPIPCSQATEPEMDGRPGGRYHQTGKQPVCHSESVEINLTILVSFSIYFLSHVEIHHHHCGLSSNNVGNERCEYRNVTSLESESFHGDLFCLFRLTFCCSPAVNRSTWCTSRRQNWMG